MLNSKPGKMRKKYRSLSYFVMVAVCRKCVTYYSCICMNYDVFVAQWIEHWSAPNPSIGPWIPCGE